MCATVALAGERVVAAYPAALGEVREHEVGRRLKPAESFAPGQPEGAVAAWCWIDSADGTTRRVVATVASGEQVTFVSGNATGLTPGPDGPSVP
jgi:hypothetical protein